MPRTELRERLRLIVITDTRIAEARGDGLGLHGVLERALGAGAPCVQLRMKGASARTVADVARALLPRVRRHGALLFVNDRADVAAAIEADGVHLGGADVPVAAIRRAFGRSLAIGYSTDDPAEARAAQAEGADYIGCGAVFETTSRELGGEAIGVERLAAVVRAVDIPVVGIGGITPERATAVIDAGACGVAVISAVMAAPDPARAVLRFLGPGGSRPGEGERTS